MMPRENRGNVDASAHIHAPVSGAWGSGGGSSGNPQPPASRQSRTPDGRHSRAKSRHCTDACTQYGTSAASSRLIQFQMHAFTSHPSSWCALILPSVLHPAAALNQAPSQLNRAPAIVLLLPTTAD